MSQSDLRRLEIDESLAMMAFGRDLCHQAYDLDWFLDLETGDLHEVFENDEDARGEYGDALADDMGAIRQRIETHPDKYLVIPGLEHAEHHRILQDFRDSSATNEEEVGEYDGSIGRWRRSVADQNVQHAYDDHVDVEVHRMAETFLREHGVEPVWTVGGRPESS